MLIILIGKKGVGKLSIMHKLMEEYKYQPFINQGDDEIKTGKYVGVMNPDMAQRIISNRNRDNIIVAYVSVSENIRKKRAIREAPELKSIWESSTEIENKSFNREFVANMIDIAVYNDGKLQDTVSTLLYKVSRY